MGDFCGKVGEFYAKGATFSSFLLHFSKTADGVAPNDGPHDGGDGRVEPIALQREVEEREHHAQDGGEDERHHAALAAAVSVEGRHTVHDDDSRARDRRRGQ